ncbi:MAG: acetyl-coenzyme A synthetase N-terminal domain-containing protein [Ferruginibacter sp.]
MTCYELSLSNKILRSIQSRIQKSINDPENFWSDIAENFHWHKKWDTVLEWNFKDPSIKWFAALS